MTVLQVIVLLFLSLLVSGCDQEKQMKNGAAQAPASSRAEKPVEAAAPPLPVPAPKPELPKPVSPPLPAPDQSKTLRSSRPLPQPVFPAPKPTAASKAPRAPATSPGMQKARKPGGLNQYAVKVAATSPITLDMNKSVKSAGQLRVWVGHPGYEPSTPAGMAEASRILETAAKADTARITPVFSDPLAFDTEPKESKCQAVEPTGSEVTFAITPNKTGDFKVGASVELYQSPDCSGAAITKTAEPITVQVKVAVSSKPFLQGIFDAFMKFFYEFLAICVAALVVLFRKKIFPFMDKS